MSITAELNKSITNLIDSYSAAELAGATTPNQRNFDDLPATIESIDAAVAEGVSPLAMNSVSDYPARDYKIYGNSYQQTPSPGLDYPQEIKSVGSLSPNLYSDDDFVIDNTNYGYVQLAEPLQPGTYTISLVANSTDTNANTCRVALASGRNGEDAIFAQFNRGARESHTYTLTSEKGYLLLYSSNTAANGVGDSATFKNIQIQRGAEATPYVPYGKYCVPIKTSGKNLYVGSPDFNDVWANYAQWIEDGKYDGMMVMKKASAWNGLYKEISVTAGKTYNFSVWVKVDQDRPVNIYMTGGTAKVLPKLWKEINPTTNWARFSFTFTATSSGTLRPRVEPTTKLNDYLYVAGYQFEEAAVDSSYEPYHAPTLTNIILDEPLRRIGNYSDYIDFKNQKIVRNIGSKKLTGDNVNWEETAGQGFYLSSNYFADRKSGLGDGYCNLAKVVTGGAWQGNGKTGFSAAGNFWFSKVPTGSLDDWRADRDALPIEINYIINPTETSVSLPALQRFAGNPVTVSVETETQPSNMFVKF